MEHFSFNLIKRNSQYVCVHIKSIQYSIEDLIETGLLIRDANIFIFNNAHAAVGAHAALAAHATLGDNDICIAFDKFLNKDGTCFCKKGMLKVC
jgi:hypothetical protein